MIIIPDIHGRTFWKDVVKEGEQVIFLGDYLDPYPWEKISREEAIENFKEIIQYKKDHPETICLIGNHDCAYVFETYRIRSRFDYDNAEEIHKLFTDNHDLFQIAYTVPGIFFSHAGIIDDWVNRVIPEDKRAIPELTQYLNEQFQDNPESLVRPFSIVSYVRGGYFESGSIMWADVIEHLEKVYDENYYQIFGHSQQQENPIITDHYAMLDCRKAFKLDPETINLTII